MKSLPEIITALLTATNGTEQTRDLLSDLRQYMANPPSPTDHAELRERANCDWMARYYAIEIERDALQTLLKQRQVEHMDDVSKCSKTINELRAEVERLRLRLERAIAAIVGIANEVDGNLTITLRDILNGGGMTDIKDAQNEALRIGILCAKVLSAEQELSK